MGAEGTTKALLAWGESRAAAAAAARRVDRGAIVGFRSKNESERPQQAKVKVKVHVAEKVKKSVMSARCVIA